MRRSHQPATRKSKRVSAKLLLSPQASANKENARPSEANAMPQKDDAFGDISKYDNTVSCILPEVGSPVRLSILCCDETFNRDMKEASVPRKSTSSSPGADLESTRDSLSFDLGQKPTREKSKIREKSVSVIASQRRHSPIALDDKNDIKRGKRDAPSGSASASSSVIINDALSSASTTRSRIRCEKDLSSKDPSDISRMCSDPCTIDNNTNENDRANHEDNSYRTKSMDLRDNRDSQTLHFEDGESTYDITKMSFMAYDKPPDIQLIEVREHLKHQSSETSHYRKLTESLRKELAEAKEAETTLRIESAVRNDSIDRANAECTAMRSSLREKDQEFVKMQAENVHLKEVRDQQEAVLKENWTQMAELAEVLSRTQSENAFLHNKISSLEGLLTEAEGKYNAINRLSGDAKAKCNHLETELCATRKESLALTIELDSSRGSLRTERSAKHALTEQIQCVQKELKASEQRLARSAVALTERESAAQALEVECATLSAEKDAMQEEVTQLHSQVQLRTSQCEQVKVQLQQSAEEIASLHAANDELGEQLSAANAKEAELQAELEKNREVISFINQLSGQVQAKKVKDQVRRLSSAHQSRAGHDDDDDDDDDDDFLDA